MGRYGPYVQIGTKDDEEKPRFAGLRPGQRMDTISFDEAMDLFKLPRNLGETRDGEEIVINIGRFGPYVRYGSKFVSLKKEDDPYTVTLERALQLIEEKKKADAERQIKIFKDEGISILNGRYGPYVTDGKKNARVPKDREPASLTLEESMSLLEAAPASKGRRRNTRKAG
jgi:DNA topoisomerase-1